MGRKESLVLFDKVAVGAHLDSDLFIRLTDGYSIIIAAFHHDSFHDCLSADIG